MADEVVSRLRRIVSFEPPVTCERVETRAATTEECGVGLGTGYGYSNSVRNARFRAGMDSARIGDTVRHWVCLAHDWRL